MKFLDFLKFNANFNRNMTSTGLLLLGGVIVALWLITSLVGPILSVLGPLALLGMIAYFGFRVLSSRRDAQADRAAVVAKSRPAAEKATARAEEQSSEVVKQVKASTLDTGTMEALEAAEEDDADAEASVDAALALGDDDLDDLVAKPVDISRLEEKEQESKTVNDDVLSQIEERKRRLRGES